MLEAIFHTGSCTIYAAALEAGCASRFRSAVVVRRSLPAQSPEEIFRDEHIEDGQVWLQPEKALEMAIDVGVAAAFAHQALDWNKVRQLSLLSNSG